MCPWIRPPVAAALRRLRSPRSRRSSSRRSAAVRTSAARLPQQPGTGRPVSRRATQGCENCVDLTPGVASWRGKEGCPTSPCPMSMIVSGPSGTRWRRRLRSPISLFRRARRLPPTRPRTPRCPASPSSSVISPASGCSNTDVVSGGSRCFWPGTAPRCTDSTSRPRVSPLPAVGPRPTAFRTGCA